VEASLRPRLLIGIACSALLASCGETEPVRATLPGGPVGSAPPPVRPVDDPRSAAAVLEALVARGHGARRGTFDRISVELRRSPDGEATTVLARLPDRLRITHPDGSAGLLRGEAAWTWAHGAAPAAAGAESRAELERWRTLLDLLTLGPLERALQHDPPPAERSGPDRLAVGTGEARIEVELDPARDLVEALHGSGISVRILERHIGERPGPAGAAERTVVPILVDEAVLGTWHLRFLGAGIDFDEQVFAPPTGAAAPTFTHGGPGGTTAPRIEAAAAVSWLMFEDPGSWTARMQLFRSAGPRLGPLGYGNGGDPMLVATEDGPFFVIPFRPRRGDAESLVPGAGERLRSWPAGRVVAVDPPAGEAFERRIAAGRTALEGFAQSEGLHLDGPICVAVNLIGRDPAGDPESLDQAPIRVLARIAP
jgi:hypothetical protein